MARKKRITFKMSKNQIARLQEVRFYHMVRTLMETNPSPGVLYDFIETFSQLFEISSLHLQKALKDCIMDNSHFRPTAWETGVLLYLANAPVQTVLRCIPLGQASLYTMIDNFMKDPCDILPKYAYNENESISKFMVALAKLAPTVFFTEEPQR